MVGPRNMGVGRGGQKRSGGRHIGEPAELSVGRPGRGVGAGRTHLD